MKTNRLRILQTCFSRSWGGLEIQALDATNRMRARGHSVWLACCPGSRLAEESAGHGLAILPLDVSGYLHPGIVMEIRRFLTAEAIDIIHCQLSKDLATIVPAMLVSGRRIPLFLSKRMGSYISKRDPFHRFTYNHVSRVLAISEVIRRNVIETTPMKPEQVVTMHEAIDTSRFAPARADRNRVRKEFGLTDDHIAAGFVGRFSPGKGHEEFLLALHRLKPRHTNLRALIIGEASRGEEDHARMVRTTCHDLGLDELVTFAGFRKDVPDVMAAFDLFVFPSHAEAFGAVLVEAMAMERAVVSTNCDGVLDIVVDGETGIYVNPRDAAGLADAIERLIGDADLRHRMGKAGRKRVLDMFDQETQTRRIEALYYQLLDEN